ncbi:glycosyltransferase family 4 protein [Larkinella bovis]|uniref:Glycosyltransferase family 4 protein n=1 Tax=Larkinella bovis TaxID=683041 RepID=A0ABW0IIH7_9BACT
MKVAYMIGALERGGTETLLLDTIRQATPEGLDCILIYRKGGAMLSEFIQTGIVIEHLPIQHRIDILYVFRLRRMLLSHRVQIIHAQTPFDAFLAYWAVIGTQISLVLSFHGYDFGWSWFAHRMLKFIVKRTDVNIYVSNHLRNYYVVAYSLSCFDKQKVIYNGINFEKLDVSHSNTFREELGISPPELLMGCIGNFVAVRDQLTICRFLDKLQKSTIDFRFVFVGSRNSSNSLYDDCVKFCRENGLLNRVYFVGSRHDVPRILKNLDAFVYASNHDSFGIAVVEAMAAGVPVFVNDWPVMQEITEGGGAYLYRTKDSDDLLEKIVPFCQNKLSYLDKAKKNASLVKNKYSIHHHVCQVIHLYKSIV